MTQTATVTKDHEQDPARTRFVMPAQTERTSTDGATVDETKPAADVEDDQDQSADVLDPDPVDPSEPQYEDESVEDAEDDDAGDEVDQEEIHDMGRHTGEPARASLDEDPDVSLVGSLSLHMLSEHGITGSLHLDEAALSELHQQLHAEHDLDHDVEDLRFNPIRALEVAMFNRSPAPVTTTPS
jgi:hypothetical protein